MNVRRTKLHRETGLLRTSFPLLPSPHGSFLGGRGFLIHRAVERGFGLAERCWSIEVCGFLGLSHMIDVLNVRARSSNEQDSSVTETEVADGLVAGGEGIEVER